MFYYPSILPQMSAQLPAPGSYGIEVYGLDSANDNIVHIHQFYVEFGVSQVKTLPIKFSYISKDSDVRFFTGFKTTVLFKFMFDYLFEKAKGMTYWRGFKQTQKDKSHRCGLRKLSFEQEFFLVMLRLRLGLKYQDLAFRFQISKSSVSSIFTTWIKLMAAELKYLISWPSKQENINSLPESFKKNYPKTRVIIDCTEIFIQTPSSLDVQSMCWSEYKHHTTIKFLLGISPRGLITFVSKAYGGRASDKFIVEDSNFLDNLEPYDQVLADRGFKILELLMRVQASLAIPPSVRTSQQMSPEATKSTSKIANVRIYVEQAINRIKWYNILGCEMDMHTVFLCDEIILTCSALCNLLSPLA